MKDICISNEHSCSQVAGIIDVLRQPRLYVPTDQDYPNHNEWLEKTEHQLQTGMKRAMVAYIENTAVGTVIYQRNPVNHSELEVRNISVEQAARGRFIGSFLLKNSEIEAVSNDFPGVKEIVVDTKVTNREMIRFLTDHGYDVKEVVDLYGLGAGLDVVLTKSVESPGAIDPMASVAD